MQIFFPGQSLYPCKNLSDITLLTFSKNQTLTLVSGITQFASIVCQFLLIFSTICKPLTNLMFYFCFLVIRTVWSIINGGRQPLNNHSHESPNQEPVQMDENIRLLTNLNHLFDYLKWVANELLVRGIIFEDEMEKLKAAIDSFYNYSEALQNSLQELNSRLYEFGYAYRETQGRYRVVLQRSRSIEEQFARTGFTTLRIRLSKIRRCLLPMNQCTTYWKADCRQTLRDLPKRWMNWWPGNSWISIFHQEHSSQELLLDTANGGRIYGCS